MFYEHARLRSQNQIKPKSKPGFWVYPTNNIRPNLRINLSEIKFSFQRVQTILAKKKKTCTDKASCGTMVDATRWFFAIKINIALFKIRKVTMMLYKVLENQSSNLVS